ncbi:protein LNK1-like isoform X1 [Oryza glaberrima]|uniref:Protein LNK1 n=1 Tax=Oryza barthii TaxID=65489 RepID=A0A0D3FJ98_9ORYZ|nr:protein LNK1-like isoform X1 [Oryza glaberrima]XP_052147101.1 protein LNK1-like isoform X1 [Oryza glaberrima]
MPDWRVGEFEGKLKDGFARSNNSEHENGAGTVSISSKKSKHGVASEKKPHVDISGVIDSDSQKCNSEQIHSANGIVSRDVNHDHIENCKVESNDFPLNTISETRYPTDNWNSSQFALSNDGSPVLNNQSTPQTGHGYGDNDLTYIDWPAIDNFEDVDNLFRRCDSTYGQQQLPNTDELSWIPSSDAMYSSDVAMQPGFESSYSDYGILDDLSAFNCTEDKSLTTADPSSAVCDEQFDDSYLFNEQKTEDVYGEQAYQRDAMELLSSDQICTGQENLDMIGNRYSSENAMEQPEDQKFSIASGSQLSSSQNLLNQKNHLDSTSPSNITSESYPERNCQIIPSGASFAERNLKVQKKVASSTSGQLISDNVTGHPGHQTLTRRASYPCENHEIGKRSLGKRGLGHSDVAMGTSMVVDGSFVSSISSDNSVEENSFRQLQDAVSQLDVKTKMCIRDGLYRLARSAQNRQVFPNTMNNNGDSHNVKDMQNAETSGKFVDPGSIETQTNPIDRSIALLLFHQPSEHVTGAVDEAASLKSHNDNHQAAAKNQRVMHASSVHPRGQGDPMDAKSCRNN